MSTTIVPEARLSPYLHQNLLINGGFETWQRGTSFSGSALITSAEWRSAGATGSFSRNPSSKIGVYCLEMSATGSASCDIRQGIECYKSLEGLPITFSVWVKTSNPNVGIYIADYPGSLVLSSGKFHSGSGNWERLTETWVVNTGLSGFGASIPHAFGLMVFISSPTGAQTFIDGATLVVGHYPEGIPFIPSNPADDLQRCQRFYQSDETGGLLYFESQMSVTAMPRCDAAAPAYSYTTEMYAVPTLTLIRATPIDLYCSARNGAGSTLGDQANWVGPNVSRNTKKFFVASFYRPVLPVPPMDVFTTNLAWYAEVP